MAERKRNRVAKANDPWMGPTDAAGRLKVTRQTIHNWANETPPRIKHKWVGGNLYVSRADVERKAA